MEERDYLRSIVDTVRDPIVILDTDLRVVSANRAFYNAFSTTPKLTEETLIYEVGSGQWDIPALRTLLEEILPRDTVFNDFLVEHDFIGIGRRTMLLNARKLYRPGNHTEMILLAFEDVTERKLIEATRQEAHESLAESYTDLESAHCRLEIAYQREHRIADALQRPLTVEVPENAFPGLLVSSLYEPAYAEAEIGGDFYDAFALPRNQIVFAVADASGKGLEAAARAMQVKDVLRAFAREYPHSPAHITARLNDYVCDAQQLEDPDHESFVCVVIVVLDPSTGLGTALSAGAEPPFILRANGDFEIVTASGHPLGVMPQTLYTVTPLQLNVGDTMILLTDGITEARRKNEFLDHGGVQRLAQQGKDAPTLRQMGLTILDGAKQFARGTLRDDACLLLVRRV